MSAGAAYGEQSFRRKRETESVERAAVAASLAVEAALGYNVAWAVPYQFEDREAIEKAVRNILFSRIEDRSHQAD